MRRSSGSGRAMCVPLSKHQPFSQHPIQVGQEAWVVTAGSRANHPQARHPKRESSQVTSRTLTVGRTPWRWLVWRGR
jgi:hypothetical protein